LPETVRGSLQDIFPIVPWTGVKYFDEQPDKIFHRDAPYPRSISEMKMWFFYVACGLGMWRAPLILKNVSRAIDDHHACGGSKTVCIWQAGCAARH
jgi:hypothetical protein